MFKFGGGVIYVKIIYDGLISYNRVNSFIKHISSGLQDHVAMSHFYIRKGWEA